DLEGGADLGRARLRQGAQSDAGGGADRRQRLHGRGGSADGGDGLRPEGPALRALAPRLPDPDLARHAGSGVVHRREQRPQRTVRSQGGRRGAAASGDPRHRQRHPRRLREVEGDLLLGAMCTVDELARSEVMKARLPALADACSQIAGPQLRRTGTLGGNLCLDTRCVYVNQCHFWRSALGYCLKKDGTVCHVVAGGKRCVAAASNDTAPVLLALGASVKTVSPRGDRVLPLRDFYLADGIHNTVLAPDELLTEVRVPAAAASRKQAFAKLRLRAAIDFPALNLAVALDLDGNSVRSVSLAVGALAARPALIKGLEDLQGRPADSLNAEDVSRRY